MIIAMLFATGGAVSSSRGAAQDDEPSQHQPLEVATTDSPTEEWCWSPDGKVVCDPAIEPIVRDLDWKQAEEAPPPAAASKAKLAAAAEARPPAPAPASVEGWRSLVAAYFSPDHVNRALRIIACESGGDPNATNTRTGAAGLFQQLPKYWAERAAQAGVAGASIHDPTANTVVSAWLVYAGGGWGHWSSSRRCWR
jgi:hypothetical protein